MAYTNILILVKKPTSVIDFNMQLVNSFFFKHGGTNIRVNKCLGNNCMGKQMSGGNETGEQMSAPRKKTWVNKCPGEQMSG